MGSLKELKGERIHKRSIRIETYKVDEARVIVEGTLDDERYGVMYVISGARREPGLVHGMVVRFLVGEMPAKILEAEAEMPTVPLDDCDKVADSVKKLAGMRVVYGFSRAVKERMGGVKSCIHLTSLILAMGAAAVQGMAANRGHKPMEPMPRGMMLQ